MGIAGAVIYSIGFMDLWMHLVRYFHHPSGGPSVFAKVSVILCSASLFIHGSKG